MQFVDDQLATPALVSLDLTAGPAPPVSITVIPDGVQTVLLLPEYPATHDVLSANFMVMVP